VESAKKKDRRIAWQEKTTERVILQVRRDGLNGFTKEDLRRAAEDAGLSVNAWILEAIRDKM
jgi:predicted HicB family RNase H-like nuclease